ncbi:unnamed protein product, partial [Allacma fusca]
ISDLAHLQPHFTSVQISVYTAETTETENEDLQLKAVKVLQTEEFPKIEPHSIDLIIVGDSKAFPNLLSAVKDGGFLLWMSDQPKVPSNFKEIAVKNSEKGSLHLFRSQQASLKLSKQFIQISHEDFEWVSQLKLALKEDPQPETQQR